MGWLALSTVGDTPDAPAPVDATWAVDVIDEIAGVIDRVMGWVEGVVRSGAGPVVGASVTLRGPQTKRAETNTAGWYRARVKSGTYTVTVSASGYNPATRTITVTGTLTGIDFDVTPIVTPPPPVPTPVPTRLTVDPPNATDPIATYDVRASAPGYTPEVVRVPRIGQGEVRSVTVSLVPV